MIPGTRLDVTETKPLAPQAIKAVSYTHLDGEEMIDEILSLGCDHVELSHGIKLSLLPGIMRAVEAGKVQVAGVHNYFPAPIDLSLIHI